MNLFRTKQERELREQESKSDALVAELAAHVATEPAMKEQYEDLDDVCVKKAAEVTNYTAARSPRLAHAQTELKQLQWARDAVRANFSRKCDDLQRQIQAINEPHIREFHQWGLATVQDLASYAKSRQTQKWRTENGGEIVEIEGNHQALDRLRDMVFAAIHDARDHQNDSLKGLRALIAKHRAAIEDVDLTETTKFETNVMFLQGSKPETPVYDSGVMTNTGFIPIRPAKE